MRRWVAVIGGFVLGASAMGAQTLPRRVNTSVRIGEMVFAKGTALERTIFAGLDADWSVRRHRPATRVGRPSVRVGFSLDVARPRTDGEQFPLVAFDHGDTTFLYALSRRTTLVEASARVRMEVPLAGARAFGYAGGGLYALWWESSHSARGGRLIRPMASYGLGVEDPLTRRLSVRVQFGASTFMRFNRDALDATTGYAPERRVRDAASAPSAPSRTSVNPQYSIGVRFSPGGR